MIEEGGMSEDRALLERILAGETQAFTEFVKRYQRLVSHVVFRMIKNEVDREDLCQDVFVGIYQALPNFRFEAKLSTWVARVAYYRCLNYLEKSKTLLYEDLGEERSINDVEGKELPPDEYTEKRDIAHHLQEQIAQLPVKFRTVITLYHLEQMSYDEIGRVMKLPLGTVKSYLFRARKQLKEKLTAQYRPEELWQ